MSRDPRTLEEWQEAADTAYALLAIDSCRQYGLITGGPVAKIDRCEWILAEAAKRGIKPAELKGGT